MCGNVLINRDRCGFIGNATQKINGFRMCSNGVGVYIVLRRKL